jgi:hypothetical protein
VKIWRVVQPPSKRPVGVISPMSTGPVEIRPWRECPFIRGRRYRVRQSFAALRDFFTAGEILTFDSDAWSRYDGITGYFFRQSDLETRRVWDIYDDADILVWRELFEEIHDSVAPNAA